MATTIHDRLADTARTALCAALALLAALAPVGARAQWTETVTVEWSESEAVAQVDDEDFAPARYLARFGPFYVVDTRRVVMAGMIERATSRQFAAMLAAFPGLARIDIVECAGTDDTDAALALARAVRARGLATHVPANGSVRSGGVELFLGGVRRTADEGAEFAVHSWQDDRGREARDYTADSPEHRPFLAFYREVGMADDAARAFYALTNSAAFDSARYLGRAEMAALRLID